MKLLCIISVSLIVVCNIWGATNYIDVAQNQIRMVAGHVLLPDNFSSEPPLPKCSPLFPSPAFSMSPILVIGSAWNGSAWGTPPGTGSKPTFSPGHGFVIQFKTTNATLVLPDPPAAVLPLQIPVGYSLVCCQSNVAATFDMILGRAPVQGNKLYRLLTNGSTFFGPPVTADYETNYSVYTFTNGTWIPEAPIADIGEAVWVFQPPVISNPQVVGDNFSFGTLTASDASTTVEYTESLTGSWQTLTNIPGGGGVSNIIDPASVSSNAPTQRFYRTRVPTN